MISIGSHSKINSLDEEYLGNYYYYQHNERKPLYRNFNPQGMQVYLTWNGYENRWQVTRYYIFIAITIGINCNSQQ